MTAFSLDPPGSRASPGEDGSIHPFGNFAPAPGAVRMPRRQFTGSSQTARSWSPPVTMPAGRFTVRRNGGAVVWPDQLVALLRSTPMGARQRLATVLTVATLLGS
jgi:hypothetical protein